MTHSYMLHCPHHHHPTSAVPLGDRHRLDDGDAVRFEELDHIEVLQDREQPFEIERIFARINDSNGKPRDVLVPNQFKVKVPDDSISYKRNMDVLYSSIIPLFNVNSLMKLNVAAGSGGLVSQVKVPKTFSYRSLQESARNPVMPEQFMGLPHMVSKPSPSPLPSSSQ